jgi:hypothetical protein
MLTAHKAEEALPAAQGYVLFRVSPESGSCAACLGPAALTCCATRKAPCCMLCNWCMISLPRLHMAYHTCQTTFVICNTLRTCQRLMVAPIMPTNSFSTVRRRSASVSFLTLCRSLQHPLASWLSGRSQLWRLWHKMCRLTIFVAATAAPLQ